MKPIAIRPHHVFKSFVTDRLEDRVCKSIIPHPANFSGGVLTLEAMLIQTLIKRVNPDRVFEFGTYMGATTAAIAINTRPDTKIFTLDLPPADHHGSLGAAEKNALFTTARTEAETPDGFLIKRSTSVGPVILDGMLAADQAKVTRLYSDSRTFDYSPYAGTMDFIWIDGGHDYDIVKSDTENSLKLLKSANRRAVIAWHDYGNPECLGVTEYLDELSASLTVFSIGSTFTCFCCPGLDNGGIEL